MSKPAGFFLRRSMATFRHLGTIKTFEDKFINGMVENGYERDFAERCFEQIKGFGDYGFPALSRCENAGSNWDVNHIGGTPTSTV